MRKNSKTLTKVTKSVAFRGLRSCLQDASSLESADDKLRGRVYFDACKYLNQLEKEFFITTRIGWERVTGKGPHGMGALE